MPQNGFWGRLGGEPLLLLLFIFFLTACSPLPTPSAEPPDLSTYPWLYLRDDQPLTSTESFVQVIAVGDILLGRGVDGAQAFERSAAWLSAADLALGNLECVLASVPLTSTVTLDHSIPPPVLLSAPLEAADWLAAAGFDLLGLANNHALDAGPAGLQVTNETLHAVGLATVGAGLDQVAALSPFSTEIKGLRLAVLSVNAVPAPVTTGLPGGADAAGWQIARWQLDTLLPALQQARLQADAVLVLVHWGYEYQRQPDPAQERYAQVLLDAGADVVIGHHPHVVQAPQVNLTGERVQLVAYSLGNFAFDSAHPAAQTGLTLRLFFDQQGLRAAQALPLRAGPQPALLPPPISLVPLEPLLSTHAFACAETCQPAPLPAGSLPASGRFTTGQADLDGDGQPEQVTLEAAYLTITHAGQLAWRSPSTWQVVDAALGDPDQDGRRDLLAIFWKPDQAGILRSHPFLIRSEQGRYVEVWGGSAVSEPILEAELGDLDGDGLEELVVLEQDAASSAQTLSLWRWHGWGFSLDWRSAPGDWENLRLVEDGARRLILIDAPAG